MAVSTARPQTTHAFDAALQLQDAGLVAASAAGTRILDLGPGTGFRCGKIVIDVTAIEIASNDETYTIHVQGAASSTFATAGLIVEFASLQLSAKETKLSDSDRDDDVGQRTLYFDNTDEAGTTYRYLRLYITVAGTVATGINFSARLVPIPQVA